MEHKLFKPKDFNQGKHAVVGNCNNMTMEERWEKETPVFADAILKRWKSGDILDYGCGVGRLSKEILSKNSSIKLYGVDASQDMLNQAQSYVDCENFITSLPTQIPEDTKFNVIYCVYVLQHVPAIEIREILSRIHFHLEDEGTFVYCSSDYRMAIRHDEPGFFDDRFLGVNLREEISRFFDLQEPLFDEETLNANPVVKTMVQDGLQHPALVFKKKKIKHYFNPQPIAKQEVEVKHIVSKKPCEAEKLLLINRLAPGDCLVMTNAIRDLHLAYPGRFKTDVRTPCPEIFKNNKYITKLNYNEQDYQSLLKNFNKLGVSDTQKHKHVAWLDDILVVDMHYPLIHSSGTKGSHFAEGHTQFLEEVLELPINQTDLRPQIYLNENEKNWVNPLILKKGIKDKYWVLNAGSKGDFTLKQYPYYQEVVNLLKDKVKLVQVGLSNHKHSLLDGTIDMLNQTNVRELMRLIYHSEGVISCVSFPMHIAAAFNKPCVVVAGAREGTRWELYPSHQFMYVNGCLPCAKYDGCWKSKSEECVNKVEDVAKCMTLIRPEDVARSVERYYEGGMLTY